MPPLSTDHNAKVTQPQPPVQGFFASFFQTLTDIFTDKGIVLMLIIAPIIYGFFYPWPYSSEVVNHVPVGIVDKDNSDLSRTIVRYASASPQLDTRRFLDEQSAKEAIWADEIAGYMVIPSGLEQNVLSGKAASVSVLGNGGYFLLNKNVQMGFLKAVSTVSAGVKIKKECRARCLCPDSRTKRTGRTATDCPAIQPDRRLWRLCGARRFYYHLAANTTYGHCHAHWYLV